MCTYLSKGPKTLFPVSHWICATVCFISLSHTVKRCFDRWTSLRTQYMRTRRELRAARSGSEGRTPHTWALFDIMAFLEPHVAERATSSNYPPPKGKRNICHDCSEAAHNRPILYNKSFNLHRQSAAPQPGLIKIKMIHITLLFPTKALEELNTITMFGTFLR